MITENRRMIILSLLKEAAYAMNEDILQSALETSGGYKVSADELRTELSWLKDMGLVHIDPLQQLWIAKLTRRGLDVASGRATVPGVQRPRPEV